MEYETAPEIRRESIMLAKNTRESKRENDYLVKVRCACWRQSAGSPGRDTRTRLPQLCLGKNKEKHRVRVISQLPGSSGMVTHHFERLTVRTHQRMEV